MTCQTSSTTAATSKRTMSYNQLSSCNARPPAPLLARLDYTSRMGVKL